MLSRSSSDNLNVWSAGALQDLSARTALSRRSVSVDPTVVGRCVFEWNGDTGARVGTAGIAAGAQSSEAKMMALSA